MALPDASTTRTDTNSTHPEGGGLTAGKQSKGQAREEGFKKVRDRIEEALKICGEDTGDTDAWKRIKDTFYRTAADLRELDKLTREKGKEEGEDRMEKVVARAIAKGLAEMPKTSPTGLTT